MLVLVFTIPGVLCRWLFRFAMMEDRPCQASGLTGCYRIILSLSACKNIPTLVRLRIQHLNLVVGLNSVSKGRVKEGEMMNMTVDKLGLYLRERITVTVVSKRLA